MAVALATDIVLDVAKAVGAEGLDAARAALTRKASTAKETPEAYQKFESMVLGSFLQTMMPKDTESVYGTGLAGEMWQSMLSQQLGDVIARRGGIGIADRLLSDHYVEGETLVPLGPRVDADLNAEVDEKRLMSVAMVQEIQRMLARSMSGEASDPTEAG